MARMLRSFFSFKQWKAKVGFPMSLACGARETLTDIPTGIYTLGFLQSIFPTNKKRSSKKSFTHDNENVTHK